MNCRDSESLILAERDGMLTDDQLAVLSDHVAACPGCRRLRADVAAASGAYRAAMASVPAPNADEAWRELQGRLRGPARRERRHPLAPVVWFGAPFAAAAALAFAFFVTRPAPVATPGSAPVVATAAIAPPPPPLHDPSIIAGADFVEVGDPEAATIVFVDDESGWLVVWASDPDTGPRG